MIALKETATHLFIEGKHDLLATLVKEFAYHAEQYWHAVSYLRWKESDGKEGWDGFIRPVRIVGNGIAKTLRGRKVDIIEWARDNKLQVDTSRLLPLPFRHLTIDDIPADLIAGKFQLDDAQRRCILNWMRQGIGINQTTVGGGKTAAFGGAAAFIKRYYAKYPIIYLTPSERLVRQSTKELRSMLPNFDIGQFGGGYKDYDAEDIVVCTVAMLNRHFKDLASTGFFKKFIAIMYDECHHATSESSQRILAEIPAYFRLGASDTTNEKNEDKWTILRGLFGPVINVVKAAPLVEAGRIARPHIYVVHENAWRNKYQDISSKPAVNSPALVLSNQDEWIKGTYLGPVVEKDENGDEKFEIVKTADKDEHGKWIKEQKPITVVGLHRIAIDGVEQQIPSTWCLLNRIYDRCIIRFKERNDLIVKWAKHYSDRGLPTVVVCTRTLHVLILETLLKRSVDPELVEVLVGKDTPAARDRCFEWFKRTPGSILISPLVKEGVSIHEIRAGVVADYVAEPEVARQIVGRFLRQKKSGENCSEITWFRDVQHPSLRRGCNRVFTSLAQIEGFSFYDPAPNVDTLGDSAVKDTQIEFALRG